MTTTEPLTYEPADYAREVCFIDPIDRADDHDDWPIHVLGSRKMFQLEVAIDGEVIPGVKDAKVEFGRGRATIVTLFIDPNLCDVAVPSAYDEHTEHPGMIDDHLVLTAYRGLGVPFGWAWDWKRELVACDFHVARVVFE